MQIKVYNNQKLIYAGSANQFLADNDHDPEVQDLLTGCRKYGKAERKFFSGTWRIEKDNNSLFHCTICNTSESETKEMFLQPGGVNMCYNCFIDSRP